VALTAGPGAGTLEAARDGAMGAELTIPVSSLKPASQEYYRAASIPSILSTIGAVFTVVTYFFSKKVRGTVRTEALGCPYSLMSNPQPWRTGGLIAQFQDHRVYTRHQGNVFQASHCS
jgi:hypothetical protein